MTSVEYIKELYEKEGLSLREIAKRTNKDFRTVQKYAYRDNWSPAVELPELKPDSYPVLGDYIPTIEGWLEDDEREPRKQRHTTTHIFNRLKKECGYKGGYCSIKRYIARRNEILKKSGAGFLPMAHPTCHVQVDFGDFKYYDVAGVAHDNGHALIVSFVYSNAAWMQVFPSENQECLLEGLKRIFMYIGGVPVRARFDNMTTAVSEVKQGAERVLADGFRRFMLHYRFEADFCNPAKGNEKGNVENKVGYTRRNMLVPVPTIADFDEYNAELLKRCDDDHDRVHYKQGKTIAELWSEERGRLLTLPEYEYDVFRYEGLPVNKYGFITLDKVKYGLSPEMSGKKVQAKIYFNRIEAYYDHSLLKTFVRSYDKGDEVYDWREYLSSLSKKPGAVPHTRFFGQFPELWQEHLRSVSNHERKSALLLLMEIVREGNESLCDEALELAIENGRTDADSIRQCYYLIAKAENYARPLDLSGDLPKAGFAPNLADYDVLYARFNVNIAPNETTETTGGDAI